MKLEKLAGKILLKLASKVDNACTASFYTVGVEKMPKAMKSKR